MIARSSLGISLGAALSLLACGGEGTGSGSGGASPGTGGAPATGGVGSGTGGASSSGGTAATGGGSSTGGSASGTGGTSSTVGWDEVRCWDYHEGTDLTCYGRLGNLWALVAHVCTVLGEPHHPMAQNTTACASEDSSAPWDETWCDDEQCYGRFGDWLTVLRAPCETPEGTLSSGTPRELFCAGDAEPPMGWHDVECLAVIGTVTTPYCYGFIGLYFPKWGLFPTCLLEAIMVDSPDYVEIPADAGVCP